MWRPKRRWSSPPRAATPDRAATAAAGAALHDVALDDDAAPAAAPAANPAIFSEDLLPQRLPKRGRRGAPPRGTVVAREAREVGGRGGARAEHGARPTESPGPLAPAATPAPAHAVDGLPTRRGDSALHFPPGGPALAGRERGTTEAQDTPGAGAPGDAATPPPGRDGGERFAFFAAFRAAAEQAREEAGIDDRRVGQ